MESIKIALDKLWNILIALIIGEVTTAFHYGYDKLGWLLTGLFMFVILVLIIAGLSYKLAIESKENDT